MESIDIAKVADDLLTLSRDEGAGFEFEKKTYYGNGYPQPKYQFLDVLIETDNPHLPLQIPASVFVRDLSQFGEQPIESGAANGIVNLILEKM